MGRLSWIIQSSKCNCKCPCNREVGHRTKALCEHKQGNTQLALKMKEGDTSHGLWGIPLGARKGKKTDSPIKSVEEEQPC